MFVFFTLLIFMAVCVRAAAALKSTDLTLEEPTQDGDTCLTLAVELGLLDNVNMLLEHGASPHNTNSKNESPLLIGSKHTPQRCACTMQYVECTLQP